MSFGQFLKDLVMTVEGFILWLLAWLGQGGIPRILAVIVVIVIGVYIFRGARNLFHTSEF